jgi:hypothetical protein
MIHHSSIICVCRRWCSGQGLVLWREGTGGQTRRLWDEETELKFSPAGSDVRRIDVSNERAAVSSYSTTIINNHFLHTARGTVVFYLDIGGWSPYWVHSALRPLLAYSTCPGWLWGWRSWWNERFWQGKPKYSDPEALGSIPAATRFSEK